MEAAFSWIGAIVEWLGQWVPRLVIIPTTHGAVKFRMGSQVIPLKPGLHFYWPLITRLETYAVARQTTDLRPQKFTLKDDTTVTVGAVITYEIVDIEKILAFTWDADNTVIDVALSAVTSTVVGLTWEQLRELTISGALAIRLRQEARKVLEPFGVRVIKMNLTDMAKSRVINLVTSTNIIS